MDDPDTTIAAPGTGPPIRAPLVSARGESVGRYVVLEQLGRGGMGVVYSAFDPQLDRKVALKVLHDARAASPGASEGASSRLLREAQSLAKLSHPNVIPVHDVGTVGESVFIAMEFVDGPTLGAWAREEPSLRARVEMWVAAGRGIAAAHRAGIVHRDFKPDNVMIGKDGRPRVLDFGLARVAKGEGETGREPALSERSHEIPLTVSNSLALDLTETGAVMGTPAYMAPEQHLGHEVDERSDQFAFCVSLYEGLYGERPFAGETLAALAFQVCQGKVRDPPKGSTVPGWLRAVLLRGLAQDPDQRYPTMDALLRELSRDPARQRRRWLLAAGAVVLVAGLGALGRSLLAEPRLCTGAEEHLAGIWDRPTREAMAKTFTASELAYADDALRGVSATLDTYAREWTDMRTEACAATRIRGEQSDEVLTLRMACLDRSLAELSSLVEVLRVAEPETIEGAVAASESLPPLRLCADVETLRRGVRPPASEAQQAVVDELRPHVDEARALLELGENKRARDTIAARREEIRASGYRPLIAEAELIYGEGSESAEQRLDGLERAVWMAEAGRHDRLAADAWIRLATVLGSSANEFERGLRAVERAEAAIERIGGDPELRARLDVAHGTILQEASRPEEALVFLRRAREARVEAGQGGSPRALWELVGLSAAMMSAGRVDEAKALLEAGIAEARDSLGPDHPWVARLTSTLARAHYIAGDLRAAEEALRSSLKVMERAYGERSANVASVLNGLALVLDSRGHPEEAREIYERSLAISLELLGPGHGNVAVTLNNLGGLYRKLGEPEAALERLSRSYEITVELYGSDNLEVGFSHDNIANVLRDLGRFEEALARYEAAIALFEAKGGDARANLVYSLTGRAVAQLGLGRRAEARASLERAAEIVEELGESVSAEARAWNASELAKLLEEEP